MDLELTFPGGKRVEASYKGFKILTDQPEYSGGGGSAPAPFDLFLASIGTCGAYYVLAFCQARDISTEGLKVIQSISRDPEKKMITRVDLKIHPPVDFPEKYRDALVKAAQYCAVAKHLLDPPEIRVSLAESDG